MMNIDKKLEDIATNQFSEFSYVFENWYDADMALEKVALPAIICVLPVDGNMKERNGRTYDAENVMIAFVDSIQRDANGNENSEVYNRMKFRGWQFLQALNRCGYFEPIGIESVHYSVIYEQLSTIVTGVAFDLQLTEKLGRC